jgi:hypothetical protein
MTQNENIMKSLHALAKQEQTLEAQGSDISVLKDLLSKALHTITMHEHKLNLLCGISTTLAVELHAVKNQKIVFGVN